MINYIPESKAKLSDIKYNSDAEEIVAKALASSTIHYVAIGETKEVIEHNSARFITIDSNGKTIFLVDDVAEDKVNGNLYKISISDNKIAGNELYDTDVYADKGAFTKDGSFKYFKDVSNEIGALYINKEKIDDDVWVNYSAFEEETDKMVYFKDWDEDNGYGTLKMYSDGKEKKIADDVHKYELTTSGEILYLYDYSTKYFKGDLYLYKNGKSIKIDEDVNAVIPM